MPDHQAEISIREISYEEAAELWARDLWAHKPTSVRPTSSMRFLGGFSAAIHQFTPVFFGAFADGALIGLNSGHPTSSEDFRARGLYVHPSYRKRGAGKLLLRRVVDYAFSRGFSLVWSYPRESAWAAYSSSGFTRLNRKLRPEDQNCYAYVEVRPGELTRREEGVNSQGWIESVARKLNEVSPTFCLANWTHRVINLHENSLRTCCLSRKLQIEQDSGSHSLWEHSQIQEAQVEMRAGKRVDNCSYCWDMEDRGALSERAYLSSRQWVWRQFESIRDDDRNQGKHPLHLEVVFDNVCQMKCMYCGPQFSTLWEKEINEFGAYPDSSGFNGMPKRQNNPELREQRAENIQRFWRLWPEIHSSLQYLHVSGGEPLLSSHVWALFDDLARHHRPNLRFMVNSNFNHDARLMDKFIQKLAQIQPNVQELQVTTSIDTHGRQAEYIRFGLVEGRLLANAERLLSESPAGLVFNINIAVNILCLPGLRVLLGRVLEWRHRYPQHIINFDSPPVVEPSFMRVSLLPEGFVGYLDSAISFMEEHRGALGFTGREISRIQRIRLLMKDNGTSSEELRRQRRDFYKFIREHDRRRATNFLATFPEYQEFWETCAALSSST